MARPNRTASRAALLGAVVFVCACALPWVGLLDRSQVGDTPLYRSYGEAMLDGRLPYRDFDVEYPPAALPVFLLPALVEGVSYATAFKVLMLVAGIATIGLTLATLARVGTSRRDLYGAALMIGVAPALVGPVFLINYDLWPAALAAAAVALLVARRDLLALATLAVATAAKIYPVVILPVALLYIAGRSGRSDAFRAGAVFGGVFAAIVVPLAALAPEQFASALGAIARRPLQIESLGSSVLLALHSLGLYEPTVVSSYGSQNLDGPLPRVVAGASASLGIGATGVVWFAFSRRHARPGAVFVASAGSVVAAVAFGKVLSPQFLVWLVPFGALALRAAGMAPLTLLAASLALTHVWFPSRYGELVALGDVGWVVLLRNVLLVALFFALFARLQREPAHA